MMDDSYRSLQGQSEATIRLKNSKFLGYSRQVRSEEEAKAFLDDIKLIHPKARHYCYAWRIGHSDLIERSSDDGEPSGTAGRPILGQLVKCELTDAMIIIVRYFGGILLGTSGLIQAYKACASAVISDAKIVQMTEKSSWSVVMEYALVNILEEWAPRLGFEIQDRTHGDSQMTFTMTISKDQTRSARLELVARLLDIYPEEVDEVREVYEQFIIRQVGSGHN